MVRFADQQLEVHRGVDLCVQGWNELEPGVVMWDSHCVVLPGGTQTNFIVLCCLAGVTHIVVLFGVTQLCCVVLFGVTHTVILCCFACLV